MVNSNPSLQNIPHPQHLHRYTSTLSTHMSTSCPNMHVDVHTRTIMCIVHYIKGKEKEKEWKVYKLVTINSLEGLHVCIRHLGTCTVHEY